MAYVLFLVAAFGSIIASDVVLADSGHVDGIWARLEALEHADKIKTQEIEHDRATIQALVAELNECKTQLESQDQVLKDTQQLVQDQRSKLDRYAINMATQEERIEDLETKLEVLTENNERVGGNEPGDGAREWRPAHSYSSAQHGPANQSDVPSDSNVDQSKLRTYSSLGKTPRNRLNRASESADVAFHATCDKGTVSHIGIGQKIIFEDVHMNHGNGYHGQHGVFIAPEAGVYLFSTSIVNSGSDLVRVDFVKNGAVLGRALADPVKTGSNSQGSVTAVVQLAVGDEVWVSLNWAADTAYYGDRYTTFCGVLVYQM